MVLAAPICQVIISLNRHKLSCLPWAGTVGSGLDSLIFSKQPVLVIIGHGLCHRGPCLPIPRLRLKKKVYS